MKNCIFILQERLVEPVSQHLPARSSSEGFMRLEKVQAAVLECVKELLGLDVTIDAPLAAQGLDSLAALELRQKLQVRSAFPLTHT